MPDTTADTTTAVALAAVPVGALPAPCMQTHHGWPVGADPCALI